MVLSGSSGNIDINQSPVPCSTTRDLALRTQSGWLRSGTSHAKNRKAMTTMISPRARPKRKPRVRSSAPIRLSSTISENRRVMTDTISNVTKNLPPTTTLPRWDSVVVEVGLRERQQFGIEEKRRHRRDQPGGDRQDLAHKAADHGEQPRNQHDADQDDVEEGDGHDRIRVLRAFRTPPVESANEIVPTSAPPARPASPVEGSPQLINIPAVIGTP